MPVAMPHAMPDGCSGHYTQRNATDGRNVRHQDPIESSSVPDAAEPVDNGDPVFYEVGGHLIFGVPEVS